MTYFTICDPMGPHGVSRGNRSFLAPLRRRLSALLERVRLVNCRGKGILGRDQTKNDQNGQNNRNSFFGHLKWLRKKTSGRVYEDTFPAFDLKK